MIHISFIGSRY